MYHPVIKNKLNELKGLNDVNINLEFTPIIEMIDCKYDDIMKMFVNTTSKITSILKNKRVYIDLPTYVENEIIDIADMENSEDKIEFFKTLDAYFKTEKFKDYIPVISFDYNYRTKKKSYKENISFINLIIENFDSFALRLFTNADTYLDDDFALIKEMYNTFKDYDFKNKVTFIFDVDKTNISKVSETLNFILSKHKIIKLILVGEAYNNKSRMRTTYNFDRIKNHHLERVENLKKEFLSNIDQVEYADFALLDKIPSKIEIDPEKGFLYYPFIKFTTEDGNLCMFTADEKGNYEQYQELCKRIIHEMRTFSTAHCSTCQFINDVAAGDHSKFKAGATWKYRMIAHHITSMSELFKS